MRINDILTSTSNYTSLQRGSKTKSDEDLHAVTQKECTESMTLILTIYIMLIPPHLIGNRVDRAENEPMISWSESLGTSKWAIKLS